MQAELYRILGRHSEAEPLYLSASQLLKEQAAQSGVQPQRQGVAQGPGGGAGVPLAGSRGGPSAGPVFEDPAAAAAAAAAPLGHAGLTAGAAFALHNLGGLYLKQGQLQKAADSYQEALNVSPASDPIPFYSFSVVYNRKSRER